MKTFYHQMEKSFEKLTEAIIKVYGNSVTFIIALTLVIIYLSSTRFYKQDFHDCIRDIILCITFLSFFIIQKVFNKYSTVVHLKMNELVASHDKASNRMVNIEGKTEKELDELAKHYSDLAQIAVSTDNIHATHSIEHVLNAQQENNESKDKI